MIKADTMIAMKTPKQVLGGLVRWFNALTCVMMHGGHELYLVRNDPKRLFQKCLRCGHETNGWEVGK